MNGKKFKTIMVLSIVLGALLSTRQTRAESVRSLVHQANKLYNQSSFNEAVNKYDEALSEAPTAQEPRFNKANCFYRLDDLEKASQLYREVAAESKDMKLVAKAKYNLGNCSFGQGVKQRDSDLQKAIEDLKNAISYYRGTLDIEPENKKAARNIEVARLMIKDILDQLKNQQQQDPNQPQDPNQQQQQQQQKSSAQEPNQPQDPNQTQQRQEQKQKQQKQTAPQTSAQEILDKEQRRRKERQFLQRVPYQKVDKDW